MLMNDCSVLTGLTHQTKQAAKCRPISHEEIQSIEFTMPLFAYMIIKFHNLCMNMCIIDLNYLLHSGVILMKIS